MADNVFILGAGASFEAGAPMMGNFLDRSEDIMLQGEVDDFADDFQKVFSLISNLQAIYAKSDIDLSNIEAIFGVLEMAKTIRGLREIPVGEIESYRESLITVIVKTLERSILYNVYPAAQIPEPVQSYQLLSQIIKNLAKNRREKSSIITFNYDIALDHALFREGFNVQYCTHNKMDFDSEPTENSIRLLKMHGSVNWGRCTNCHDIVD
jgi:NAD-dependent SIR2 family protein deacetylase